MHGGWNTCTDRSARHNLRPCDKVLGGGSAAHRRWRTERMGRSHPRVQGVLFHTPRLSQMKRETNPICFFCSSLLLLHRFSHNSTASFRLFTDFSLYHHSLKNHNVHCSLFSGTQKQLPQFCVRRTQPPQLQGLQHVDSSHACLGNAGARQVREFSPRVPHLVPLHLCRGMHPCHRSPCCSLRNT